MRRRYHDTIPAARKSSRMMAKILAWALFALTVTLLVAAGVLQFANGLFDVTQHVLELTAGMPLLIVGPLIASRRPSNPIGWLLASSMLLLAFAGSGNFVDQVARYVISVDPGSLPRLLFLAWSVGPLRTLSFFPLVTFLILLFPTGRLPSSRWRPLAWLAAVDIAVIVAGSAFGPGQTVRIGDRRLTNPLALDELRVIGSVMAPLFFVTLGIALACGASVVARFRSARGDERQQIKWFAYGVGFAAAIAFLGIGLSLLGVPERLRVT